MVTDSFNQSDAAPLHESCPIVLNWLDAQRMVYRCDFPSHNLFYDRSERARRRTTPKTVTPAENGDDPTTLN